MSRGADETRTFEEIWSTLSPAALSETGREGRIEPAEGEALAARSSELVLERGPVRLGPLLGEGGMGSVHLATQSVLERGVAVKTLREDAASSATARRFFQEACVTALVEHPNVVPVYDLARTEEGHDALLMKRIVGSPWAAMIQSPESLPEGARADPLAWHLKVLTELCDALGYAHERGVIHRDVKPDNVMIGAHGETYLLDWGLAASVRDEHEGLIPLARDTAVVCGTPAYFAPEMARCDPRSLGPRTDVYLLGACLHEVLTGSPPHTGGTVFAHFVCAMDPEPRAYPASIPTELVDICRRAMALSPDDRYESTDALRGAVEGFLRHRRSHALVRQATEQLEEMVLLVGAESAPERDEEDLRATSPRSRLLVEGRFGAIRFALAEALRIWPDSAEARAAWQRALREMARLELSRGRVLAASALLAEQDEPDLELKARIAELEAERERRVAEVDQLRRLGHEHDLEVGRRARGWLVLALGLAWCAMNLTVGRLHATGVLPIDPLSFVAGSLLLILPIALGVGYKRELLANVANRRILLVLGGSTAVALFGRVVGAVHAQDIGVTYAREQFVYAFLVAAIAILNDWRLVAGAACLAVTATLSALFPALSLELGGLGALAASVALHLVWRRRAP